MKRLLLFGLLIASPAFASEYSKAMEGSTQVQAARARDKARTEKEQQDMQQAIEASVLEASKQTHKQEQAARSRSNSPTRPTTKPSAPAPEDTDLQKAIEASKVHPQPKATKKRYWLKWATVAGITITGAALVWYFRDNVNTYAYTGYSRLTSLYKGQ